MTKKDEINNDNNNLYDDYFIETQRLYTESKDNFIKNYIKDNRTIGRMFLDNNNNLKYFEIFKETRFTVLGLPEKITILYLPDKKKGIHDEKSIIGFRFYQNKDINKEGNYFTLIKKYRNRYFILEKELDDKLIDIFGKPFYNEDLDCLAIINNISFEKYKYNEKNRIPNGELFPEIIGFCYALLYSNPKKNCHPLEPFIPVLFDKSSQIEKIPKKLEEGIIYLEPIIYGQHVTLLIAGLNDDKERASIIIDMSGYHLNEGKYKFDHSIFTKSMKKNLDIYPNLPIQKSNTCGLWLYGIVNCLISNDIYNDFKSISMKIVSNQNDFCKDIINCIAVKLYGQNILQSKGIYDNPLTIDDDYFYCDFECCFKKEAIINCFFNLKNYIKGFQFVTTSSNELLCFYKYEELYQKIIEIKKLLDLNNEYYKILSSDDENLKLWYNSMIHEVNKIIKDINNKIDKSFLMVRYLSFYSRKDDNILDIKTKIKIRNILNKYEEAQKKEPKEKTFEGITLTQIFKDLEKGIKNCEFEFEKVFLKKEEFIINDLNPNSDILLKLYK